MNPFLRLAYQLYRLRWRIFRPITVGVRMLLVQDGTVLLVRHTYQAGWQFPGGAIKFGETLLSAAMREAYEEVGAHFPVEPRLLGLYTNVAEGKSDHVALFVSDQFTLGQPSDRWEIAERRAFPLTELPGGLGPAYGRRIQEYLTGPGPYARSW
jgi:ADP-ribose pyrophosphatase YjhB (NUDIX family)